MMNLCKLFSAVAIGAIASAPTCHAFKPSTEKLIHRDVHDVVPTKTFDLTSSIVDHGSSPTLSARGGDGEAACGSVIKYHGFTIIAFGAVFVAEGLLGLKIPLGPSAVIPGFGDGASKILSVICGTHLIMQGFMQVQSFQNVTHHALLMAGAALGTILATMAADGTGINYLYGFLMACFSLAGFSGMFD